MHYKIYVKFEQLNVIKLAKMSDRVPNERRALVG